jgi:hypothetical protein
MYTATAYNDDAYSCTSEQGASRSVASRSTAEQGDSSDIASLHRTVLTVGSTVSIVSATGVEVW